MRVNGGTPWTVERLRQWIADRGFDVRSPPSSSTNEQMLWCAYCGTEMDPPAMPGVHDPKSATRDHIVPKSVGGADGANRVWVCASCNTAKAATHWLVFLLRRPLMHASVTYPRRAKVSIAERIADLETEIEKAEAVIDAAYWRFTRQARAKPPVLAEPEAHVRLKHLKSRLSSLKIAKSLPIKRA